MKEQTAKKLLHKVKEAYKTITHEFDNTRTYDWQEFAFFKPYLENNAEIVDLGCGNGRLINFLEKYYLGRTYKYVGIDNNDKFLHLAHQKHQRNVFLPGDQLEIPISDNQTDVLFNIAAFHHIPSKNLRLQALLEMKRTIKPGGVLIITVWNFWQKRFIPLILEAFKRSILSFGDYSYQDLFIKWKNSKKELLANRYYYAFRPNEIIKLAHQAGFELIEIFGVFNNEKTSALSGKNICLILKKY